MHKIFTRIGFLSIMSFSQLLDHILHEILQFLWEKILSTVSEGNLEYFEDEKLE
jgi:hypothetical protein